MHPTQFLQDHSCSSFYCGLPRQIDPEYTGFVLCKRNMVSWLFQIVIIGWYWFYWWGCIIHILAYIVQPSAGADAENSEGVGERGAGAGFGAHASYIDTIYFIEYSLNIVQNFTEKGVVMVPSANPYLQWSLGVDVGGVTCIFLEVVGPLLKF